LDRLLIRFLQPFHRRRSQKGAKGDFVWLIFEHEAKDPWDSTHTYHFNSFEIIRIQGGKVQEHWDSEKKRPGTPVFTRSSDVAPTKWYAGKLSRDERRNLKLATEELKDMLQYGHVELAGKIVDSSYIQHNPNVTQGREGLKRFMNQNPVPAQKIGREWKDEPALTLVSGPFVVMMWNQKDKDPANPEKEYIWNHYDAVRIENGLIKEHWDEEQIAGR
jgi:predicted SnoaL-like aldol condensation-catalyzing enzyme